jgi:CNT family concentrative nucleoside transporter
VAVAFSSARRRIAWRVVLAGSLLQLLLAVLLLRVSGVRVVFHWLARVATTILGFTEHGSEYIFGPLVDPTNFGMIFAFNVLPTIIFFASFMSVLYHLGLMQVLVQGMAIVMRRSLRVSGAESLAMAANVFVGQTEAPLVVRPFVAGMTRSELMALMTGGFATIAGGVFAAYVAMLGGQDEASRVEYAKHLLCASIMSAPAAFVMAKIIIPETQSPVTLSGARIIVERETVNVIDAAARGAADGLKLALNVGAMLLAFIALLAMCDYPLERLSTWGPVADVLSRYGVGELSIATILGWVFAPMAWTMGVPWSDATAFGTLLGQKLVLTEFVAFDTLSRMSAELEPRTVVIATYALCGFANFGSIAIQLGGIGGIAPNRRGDLARLGLRAMLGGAMASWMTATIVGLLVSPGAAASASPITGG